MAGFCWKDFGTYKVICLRLDNGAEAVILPEVGAHLLSLKLPTADGPLEVIDGYDRPEQLEKLSGAKSAKLSPFPNRIAQGKYAFNGTCYQFPINHGTNAIHGFVCKVPFTAQEPIIADQGISVALTYDYDGRRVDFPFPFSIRLLFCLNGQGLHVSTHTENTGRRALPYGDGWHPYFRLGSGLVNELQLRLPACSEVLTEQMIPTEAVIPVHDFKEYSVIGDKKFDTGFQLSGKEASSSVSLKNPAKNLSLHLVMDSKEGQYRYFQLYTPPQRHSIAIEPMSCAANAFNNKMGLLVLEPAAAFNASFSIVLDVD